MTLEANIDTLVTLALAEDLGEAGDVTTQATIDPTVRAYARITAKASGVIAGLPALEAVYQQLDPSVQISIDTHDGCPVTPGTRVVTLAGSAQSLLSGERTALNFLQRLSGIATLTCQFVDAAAGSKAVILDTRKTTPGWRLLEKYAVRMGGGSNHRIGLYDMVLVKDNHISAAGGIGPAIRKVRQHPTAKTLYLTVEVETLDQLREALDLKVDRVLLDNMDTETMRQAVEITAGRAALEASGNMSLERVAAVAAAGVDFISVGALTHSAPALDLSMAVELSEGNT